jgi:hypothetical protein
VLLSRLPDQRRTPWKNGGGVTTELLALPRGATLDSFALRISRARVDGAGPFSRFPGVDRTLVVLAGEGLALRVLDDDRGAEAIELPGRAAPFAFAGERDIEATLLGGPVEDFNVMTRRSALRHEVAWERLDGEIGLAPRGSLVVLVVVEGRLVLADVGEGALVAGEALLHDEPAELAIRAENALVLRVDVFAVGESTHA